MSGRAKLGLACVLAFMLIGTASASAFVWHMRYGQAKNGTKEVAKEACREDRECIGWAAGQCYRKSESRFDCEMALFYPGAEASEEIECDILLHWGVNHSGYVVLKRLGRPHCFPI